MDQFLQNILLITYAFLSFEYLSNYTSIYRNVLNIHISIFSLENIIIKV